MTEVNQQQEYNNNNTTTTPSLYDIYLSLNKKLENGMEKLSNISSSYPIIVISGLVIVMSLLCIGLTNVTFETDVYELWIEKGSRLRKERAFVKEMFGDQRSRVNFLLATTKNGESNIMSESLLNEWLRLNKVVTQSVKVKIDDTTYDWNDVCDRVPNPFLALPCSKFTVLDCFSEGDFDFFLPRAPGVPPNLFELKPSFSSKSDIELMNIVNGSCKDWANILTPENFIMGGVSRDSNTNDISTISSFQSIFKTSGFVALAKRLYSTNNPTNEQQEKAKTIILAWEKEYINTLLASKSDTLKLSYFASRSDDDLMAKVSRGSALLLLIGYCSMLIFVGISLAPYQTMIGIIGMLLVSLSIFASLGYLAICNVTFNFMHFQVLPFLALGLGVNDLFVLAFKFRKIRKNINLSVETITSKSMREAGSSITLTSCVNMLAFGLGALMPLPALSVFSLSVAITVLFDYIMVTMAFTSLLVLNERWQRSRTSNNNNNNNNNEDEEEVENQKNFNIGRFIVNKPSTIITILLSIGIITLASIGTHNMKVGLPLQEIVPRDHYAHSFLATRDDYYTAMEASIVLGMNENGENQLLPYEINLGNMINMETKFEEQVPYVYKAIPIAAVSWVDNFIAYVKTNFPTDITNENIMTTSVFYSRLNSWLTTTTKGLVMASNLKFNNDGLLQAVSIKYYQDLSGNSQYRTHIKDSRYVLDHETILQPFPEGLAFNFYEQYLRVKSYLIENVLLALLGITLFGFVFLFHPLAVSLMVGVILLSAFESYGLIYWFGLSINGVSVINIVMGIGMSVEFTAHIIRSYMTISGTKKERAILSTNHMFAPVILGGVSTLVAIFPMLFSSFPYYKLYFFYQYVAILLIGMFNGLFSLPLLLAIIGPPSLNEIAEQKNHENSIQDKDIDLEMNDFNKTNNHNNNNDDGDKQLPTFPSSQSGAVHMPTSISGRLALSMGHMSLPEPQQDNNNNTDGTSTLTPMPSAA